MCYVLEGSLAGVCVRMTCVAGVVCDWKLRKLEPWAFVWFAFMGLCYCSVWLCPWCAELGVVCALRSYNTALSKNIPGTQVLVS